MDSNSLHTPWGKYTDTSTQFCRTPEAFAPFCTFYFLNPYIQPSTCKIYAWIVENAVSHSQSKFPLRVAQEYLGDYN